MTGLTTPREIDTKLSELYGEALKARARLDMFATSAKYQAGAKFYYKGRQHVTDMTLPEAEMIITAHVEANKDDVYGYSRPDNGRYAIRDMRRTVEGLAECRERLRALNAEMAKLEESYTGWTRFFLVTSSKGHIHSSMHCSTCRITTTYGWLPDLSGRTEADCVEEFGSALCSICYPTAPVEWTTEKLTKAAANKAAEGRA